MGYCFSNCDHCFFVLGIVNQNIDEGLRHVGLADSNQVAVSVAVEALEGRSLAAVHHLVFQSGFFVLEFLDSVAGNGRDNLGYLLLDLLELFDETQLFFRGLSVFRDLVLVFHEFAEGVEERGQERHLV